MALSDDEIADSVAHLTRAGPKRRRAMVAACRRIDADGIAGDIVECGVWKGANIILARKASPGRGCWLYDTFEGMTEPQEVDRTRGGSLAQDKYRRKAEAGHRWSAASIAEVKENLRAADALNGAPLHFVVGDVAETLRDPVHLPERIALLRLDTDWYASTKIELEALYPRLSSGGVLIIDDYGHWLGARKAVDEYFGADAAFTQIDYTAVMMVKPC